MSNRPDNSFIPELLAPAGDIDKAKLAINYGADALYLGGTDFGLRARATNFNDNDLREICEFAKSRGVKIYITVNSFLHDNDLKKIAPFLAFLTELKVDALIVSDLGVLKTIKKLTDLECHLSTQASCLNIHAAKFWKEMGVNRIILGREATIEEARHIKECTGMEVEMFVHGSLCSSYSGNCTISNFTAGRDSNRGGCAQSCRFEYSFNSNAETLKGHYLSSKDLMGISLVPTFIRNGISSLKIEGRMKSHLYLATAVKYYREALDAIAKGNNNKTSSSLLERELHNVPNRGFTSGFLSANDIENDLEVSKEDRSDYQYVGIVKDIIRQEFTIMEVKNFFSTKDQLELLPFKGSRIPINGPVITDLNDRVIDRTKPNTLIKLPFIPHAERGSIFRKKASS